MLAKKIRANHELALSLCESGTPPGGWMAADDRWAARAGWDLTAERGREESRRAPIWIDFMVSRQG